MVFGVVNDNDVAVAAIVGVEFVLVDVVVGLVIFVVAGDIEFVVGFVALFVVAVVDVVYVRYTRRMALLISLIK